MSQQDRREQRREHRHQRRIRHQGPMATVLLFLAGLLIVLAGPVAYVGGLIGNENKFVDLTDKVVDDTTVRQELAQQTADIVVQTVSNNELVQSLPAPAQTVATEAATVGVNRLTKQAGQFLDNPTVVNARDTAIKAVHRQLTSDSPGVTIDLTDTVVAISDQVVDGPVANLVATQVTENRSAVFTLVEPDSTGGQILEIARKVPSISRWLTVVWLVLIGLAIGVSRRRRNTARTGAWVIIGGTVATVVVMWLIVDQGTSSLKQAAIVGAAGRILVWDYASSLVFPLLIGVGLLIVSFFIPRPRHS